MTEISDERYEELRQILEKENGKAYSIEEAKEIGDGLLNFYEALASPSEKEQTIEGTDSASPQRSRPRH